jgi:hypothetical protein
MSELDQIIKPPVWKRAGNHGAWALCTKQGNGRWHVRRVVWGILMARAEKREGETIRRASILLRDKP